MINVTILCVGKLKEKYWTEACNEYAKRLRLFCNFRIVEADEEKIGDNPSDAQIKQVIEKEGIRLSSMIPKGAMIVAMCIEGKQRSSEALAKEINTAAVNGISHIVFVIGGSWGLSESIKKSAAVKLSMSEMTFPHQLARVMLCEQIYRAFQISSGGKYHK